MTSVTTGVAKAALAGSIMALCATAQRAEADPGYAVQTYALTADTQNAGFDYAGYNEQLQGGPYGVIAAGYYGPQLTGSDGQGSTTGSFAGTTDADPYRTSSFDQATTTRIDHGAVATATAAADLAAGTLRAAASGQSYFNGYTYDVSGRASASFGDGLTFYVPGATASTVTYIGFTIQTDGSFGGPPGSSGETILAGLTVNQAGNVTAQYYGGYSTTNVAPPVMNYNIHDNWASYSFTGGPGNYTFQGVYAATGINPYLTFGEVLQGTGYEGFVDYSHTSLISLQLPTGVTFTSNSGVFLNAPSGAVPEPASWALMIVGFGAMGVTMRRRRLLAVA